jgi:hypothetical protein
MITLEELRIGNYISVDSTVRQKLFYSIQGQEPEFT